MVSLEFLDDVAQAIAPGRILTREADLAVYSYDGALDRGAPEAVVLVKTAEEVQAIVRACARHKVPFISRGAGTNLSGGCVPLKGGVVISLALMDRVLSIDTVSRVALVEPGVVNLDLQHQLEPLGFFYAPDPASQKVCTLGGNVAENAGGPRCLKYGTTVNHVLAVEAVMPDGTLQRFSADQPGPDLCGFLVGSEGTLGVVTKAWVRLVPLPEGVRTLLAAFANIEDAIHCVSETIAAGILPRALEAMDRLTVDAVEAFMHCGYPRGAEAVLLIELDGPRERVAAEAAAVEQVCRRCKAIEVRAAKDEAERAKLWEGRRGAYAAMARLAPNVLVEDGVVPRNRLPEALARIKAIAAAHAVRVGLLFHAGDGNLHPNIIFDERDKAETARVKEAGYEMLQACVDLEGSISGEHGIGVDKREAMAWLFTPETLALFRRIRGALDPMGLANPDKVLPLAGEGGALRRFRRPLRPFSEKAHWLIDEVKQRAAGREPFTVIGAGTRIGFMLGGRPDTGSGLLANAPLMASGGRPGGFLTTESMNAVRDLDAGNYTVTVEAGVRLEDLLREAEAKGLHPAIGPWGGTLGGLLAARPWPGLRDNVLGMRVLLSTGEVVEFGGKVVKNVAGYDAVKLMLGSWGAFGIILEVTLKCYPVKPEVPKLLPAPAPFAPGRWHRSLKEAFDPSGLLSPWLYAADREAVKA